ncbi:MAG TPA: M48 family metallopeptidase [Dermatophilaceae bacterium]|nr:M48 family metallopeptidase [Dermatophilaceae bacterium]
MSTEPRPPIGVAPGPGDVEVRRSTRRRRTVSAYREGERTVVLIPARMSQADERRWVAEMLERLAAAEAKRRPSSDELARRADVLSRRYLDGRATPASIRWVGNQRGRWGSCTPSERSVRISDRVRGMPDYVVDYVVLHELAHLLVPGHGPEFWRLLEAFPRLERARGYLDGVAAAAGLTVSDEADEADEALPASAPVGAPVAAPTATAPGGRR